MRTPWLGGDPPLTSLATRLFCFPYAGGGASAYSAWRRAAPAWLDVQPVKLPGREARLLEPPARQVGPLIEALAEGMRPFLGSPFALFGHSLGAVIAFELARRLEAAATPPRRLFVSGRQSPDLSEHRDSVNDIDDVTLADAVIQFGGAPAELLTDPELREVYLPVLRADFELIESYRYDPVPTLRCGVTVLYGEDDGEGRTAAEGWQRVTTGPARIQGFDGGHFFPFAESLDAVLRAVARDLGTPADD